MKKVLAVLLTLALILSFTAFAEGDSEIAKIKESGKLVVGITDFAPMDFKDENGNWVGVDAELAQAFAQTLGVEAEFIEIEWDNKILELNSRTIDCVWNGMTLTDEVNSAMGCTSSYMNNSQVVVMSAEKLATLTEEDLASLTFAVEAGSAGEEIANENGYATTPVTSQAFALMEVAAGTSDAAIIDLLMAQAMVGEGTSYADLSYGFALNDEQYVVGFRTGSDLVDACNEFFAAANAEGGLMQELLVKYGLVSE